MNTVRINLITILGYSPYCGADRCRGTWPRTVFNEKQFRCPSCGWESKFEPEFIEEYKTAQSKLLVELEQISKEEAINE